MTTIQNRVCVLNQLEYHRSRYPTSSLQDRMGSRAHAHMHLSTGNWSNAEGSDHLLLCQQSRRDDHSTLNFAGAGAVEDSGRVRISTLQTLDIPGLFAISKDSKNNNKSKNNNDSKNDNDSKSDSSLGTATSAPYLLAQSSSWTIDEQSSHL